MNQHRPAPEPFERIPTRTPLPVPQGPERPRGPDIGTGAKVDTSAEIGDLWRILVRRRRAVLGITAAFGLAALLYAFLATPLYTASAQILIDPRDRQVVSGDLNATALAPDGGVTQVESQVRVIESDAVLARAVADAGLEADPEFGGLSDGLVSRTLRTWPLKVFGPDERERSGLGRALRALRRKLAVKRADKVFVVDVIVTATEPDKAARIVNAVAKGYLADQAEARAEAARQASGELRARLDALRAEVNEAETRLEAFKARNGLIASSGRLVGEQQLTDSNARLVAARNRTAEARAKLQGVRDARGAAVDLGALPEALQSATVERLRAQGAELTAKEADLRTQLGSRHPNLTALRSQKAEVKRLIDAELDRIVQAAEVELQRALAGERTLTGNLEGLRLQSVDTARAGVELRELEREVEARRSVYGSFLTRSREIAEQANIDPTNARVIGWARPPEERSWPLRLLVIGAGLLGGLGFGAGFAMLREYAEPTLLSRRQCESLLGAPVLATLPVRGGASDALLAGASFALDALCSLSGPGHARHRTLGVLVTSAASDTEARRAAIDTLARAATARGDLVLVIDADLSAADLGDGGLLETLRGEVSLQAACTTDPATGAERLATGNGRKPVRNAFDRENIRSALAQMAGRFDLVLVDGGALSQNLRIGPLAAALDRLLVVARGGRTLQADLVALGRVAAALGQPVFGSLLVEGGEPRNDSPQG